MKCGVGLLIVFLGVLLLRRIKSILYNNSPVLVVFVRCTYMLCFVRCNICVEAAEMAERLRVLRASLFAKRGNYDAYVLQFCYLV